MALDGKTGIDCFDDWVKELKSYGYLHNHSRMWFASIWIHTLQLPWELGANFFKKSYRWRPCIQYTFMALGRRFTYTRQMLRGK